MEFPGALRRFRVPRPLLVDVSSGVGKDAAVKIRAIPGHDESAGAAGTVAHCGSAIRVFRQLDVVLLLDKWQDLCLYKLRVLAGHRVVLEAALTALGVTTAVPDRYG